MEFFTFEWVADPGIWVSLVTLMALEIVLGIDNLVFISILGYVYFALGFSVMVEALNTWVQRRRRRARAAAAAAKA